MNISRKPSFRILSICYLYTLPLNLALTLNLNPSLGSTPTEQPHRLTLREALRLSKQTNPELKAAEKRELQAQAQISITESDYYPHISIEAMDTTGFPGSSGGLDLLGLSASPFRSGLSVGAAVSQDLWDFGRTSDLKRAAEFELKTEEQRTGITLLHTQQAVIRAYFHCTFNQAEQQSWAQLAGWSEDIYQEAQSFVQTGQRSVVDSYLAKTQYLETLTRVADYQARKEISQSRLALLIGITSPIECVYTREMPTDLEISSQENPYLAASRFQLLATQAQLSRAQDENLPRLLGLASIGYIQDSRLVPVENYSLGIGIILPLFEGFRIQQEITKASARVEEKSFQIQQTHLSLSNLNEEFEEKIQSANTRRQHLQEEKQIAEEGFKLARKRYYSLQGDLTDVRDALKELERITSTLNHAEAEYLESMTEKLILIGKSF